MVRPLVEMTVGKNGEAAFVVADVPQERLETASVEYRQTLLRIDVNGDAVAIVGHDIYA